MQEQILPIKGPVRRKKTKPKLEVNYPETEEEKEAWKSILIDARTVLAISQIKRMFSNREQRKDAFEFLISK